MKRPHASPEPAAPNLYSDAGLASHERRERRELLETVALVWVIGAIGAVTLFAATGQRSAIVAFGLFAVAGTAFLARYGRAMRKRAEFRRRAVRELAARADELDAEEAEATLDRLHAKRRRLFVAALIWGSISISMATAAVALGPVSSGAALVGGTVCVAAYATILLNGIRKLDRDFARGRVDTRAFLAAHGDKRS